MKSAEANELSFQELSADNDPADNRRTAKTDAKNAN
jgi:hypothetical protein